MPGRAPGATSERPSGWMRDFPASRADHAPGQLEKFFQYWLAMGPRWPWYLEPTSPEPYG